MILIVIDFYNFAITSVSKTIIWLSKANKLEYINEPAKEELMVIRAEKHLESIQKKILKQIKDEQEVIFVPDGKLNDLWRRQIYPRYKSNRDEKESSSLKELLKSGVKAIKRHFQSKLLEHVVGSEGDDYFPVIIKYGSGFDSMVMVSSDKDLSQLISDRVYQLSMLTGKFLTKIEPNWSRGDPVDNIPVANNWEEELRNIELMSLAHVPVTIQRKIYQTLPNKRDWIHYSFGLCCIHSGLRDKGIYASRKPILKTILERGLDYLIQVARDNLRDLQIILRVVSESLKISVFRLPSDLIPHLSNPGLEQLRTNAFEWILANLSLDLLEIGNLSRDLNIRLTFHPGQYNVIGTPNLEAWNSTLRDLSGHARILDLMHLGRDSVMVVHGGGSYGNKEETKQRWVKQFMALPINIQRRLVLENDERQYSAQDCLDISNSIWEKCQYAPPVVFDLHHHQCYQSEYDSKQAPVELANIMETWTRRYIRPKFHISSQAEDKKLGAHADMIVEIPKWLSDLDLDLMIEAKGKETAIFDLISRYYN